ncbi:MAG TPA: CoA transferase [Candidatus Binataceae bacterium]|nr:CoA transferase [Candidatus Binataceae bacterium]
MAASASEFRDPPAALADVRVVELPCLDPMPYFAAAMAAKAFADLGAEVVKVEPRRGGAAERWRGPFRDEMPDPETGGLHLFLNTNKKGVTLDLDSARDCGLLFELLASTDIVLNPNSPRLNYELGLDWRGLCARFPRLIVVSLTFFGVESPYSNHRGGDLIVTHMSGVGFETPLNQVIDPANQPPLKAAGRQSDYLTGYTAAAAAMCALFDRQVSGAGQHVDASQWLAMANMVRPNLGVLAHDAPTAPFYARLMTRLKTNLPWVYPCRDGWVSFSALTDRFWKGSKKMLGNPAWADSELFDTLPARLANADALEAAVIGWMAEHDKREIFERAQAEHVPCFPVYTPAEVASDPQYVARRFFIEHDHRAAREVKMPGAPYLLSLTPWRIRRGAPTLGAHNRDVLGADFETRTVETHLSANGESAAPRDRAQNSPRPFEGVRIADFGWIFAIPHATSWLAALGADVIRIESMRSPDIVRFLSGTDGMLGPNRSGIFNSINFSRRSITLNLSHPDGAEIARRLVATSDIVTENFTVGTMEKFGLDYGHLSSLKPGLIMLSGTPLGQTGPYAHAVGWGPTTQAYAGICHLTGYPDGPPSGIGGTWPDFAVGVATAFVLMAALHHRRRTGEGQFIDLSMAELVSSMLPEAFMDYFLNGRDSRPLGNRDECLAPHGVFPAAGNDSWLAIAIATDDEFRALCEMLGDPMLALDPRYQRIATRLSNVETLEAEIAALTRGFERDDLVARLRSRQIAAGPVYRCDELMNDPAFQASGMLTRVNHKEVGERIICGLPVGFSALSPEYRPAPLIGEHTEQVLGELGYSSDQIARLRAENVLF